MAVKRLTSTSSVFRRFGSCEIAASSVGLCVGIVVDCWLVGVVGVVGVVGEGDRQASRRVGFSTPSSTFVCARLPLRFRRDSFASNLATAPLTGGAPALACHFHCFCFFFLRTVFE
ncbi:hypothetical protein F5X97DRAFT_236728 [Nemania serpens]|nr:hypothetical protein F5X97DRAFT_236728 [Nemania serpens]